MEIMNNTTQRKSEEVMKKKKKHRNILQHMKIIYFSKADSKSAQKAILTHLASPVVVT